MQVKVQTTTGLKTCTGSWPLCPPNETTAQKQEEALEKKESQQIVALKSLVAELEAKIKTIEEEKTSEDTDTCSTSKK